MFNGQFLNQACSTDPKLKYIMETILKVWIKAKLYAQSYENLEVCFGKGFPC